MRNLTLSIIALGACFLVFTNVQAQAEWTTFDFELLEGDLGHGLPEINRYMSAMMGCKVVADDAQVIDNEDIVDYNRAHGTSYPTWLRKGYYDDFLRCNVYSGDIEIVFEKPIIAVKGDGYAFETRNGAEFYVKGYDSTYGSSIENPCSSALVGKLDLMTGSSSTGHDAPFEITFSRPVTLLTLSTFPHDGTGKYCIGIDNLAVEPVPVPGAGLLGMLGMGITGWLKRRKTL